MTSDDETKDEPAHQATQDDSGINCTICMEEWTIGGDHRLCCLKCGHLFGRSCIERWIKEKGSSNSKCPTCNKTAKKTDLRDLWCKSIRAHDNSELIQLQGLLESERKLRKGDSAVIFHQNLKLELLHAELDKLKKGLIDRDIKIKKLEGIIDRFNKLRANALNPDLENSNSIEAINDNDVEIEIDPIVVPQELKGNFFLSEKIQSSSTGGCKTFCHCATSCVLLVAQPAPLEHRTLFSGYGLRRYSTIDTNVKEFIPLHSKPITSIQLKPIGDLILTAGQDKKVRLTSTSNNACIQTYNCDHEPTCVAWSSHRDQQFYVGSGNCYVTLYDLRNTSEHIYQTSQRIAKTRIISVAATDAPDSKGIIVNDLKNCQYLEVSEESNYDLETIDRSKEHLKLYNLPFEGLMGTADFDKRLNLTLISTRRSAMNARCSHNLIKLEKVHNEDGDTCMRAKPIRSFIGGSTTDQPLLSQSRILRHPTIDDCVLVGASDQVAAGVKLWDSSDNTVYQTIKTDNYIRDMTMFSPTNSNQHMLYLLSEQGISIYRWDYA